MLELGFRQDVPQNVYKKLLNNEINSFQQFINEKEDLSSESHYTIFYYIKNDSRKKYLIDSIFLQW